MSEHAARTEPVPDIFLKRLEDKLADPKSYVKYRTWCESPETADMIRLLRDIFCRPVEGPVTPDEAHWILAFNCGAWSILDHMTAFIQPKANVPEPEPTYTVPVDADDTGDAIVERVQGNSKKKGR